MVNGIAQKPIEGVSMDYTFDRGNANAPSTRTTQYFEMFGNRAIYHEGWIAATTPPAPPWLLGTAKLPDVVDGYKWELYNIADDYSEYKAAKPRRRAADSSSKKEATALDSPNCKKQRFYWVKMAGLVGLEPTTAGLEVQCSIH